MIPKRVDRPGGPEVDASGPGAWAGAAQNHFVQLTESNSWSRDAATWQWVDKGGLTGAALIPLGAGPPVAGWAPAPSAVIAASTGHGSPTFWSRYRASRSVAT